MAYETPVDGLNLPSHHKVAAPRPAASISRWITEFPQRIASGGGDSSDVEKPITTAPSKPSWLGVSSTALLTSIDYLGSKLAGAFGITSPRYAMWHDDMIQYQQDLAMDLEAARLDTGEMQLVEAMGGTRRGRGAVAPAADGY